ncbi:MAG TPA: 3-phosphoshikimate 1-carboxyvinyltransferase [Verrucomicrobiae bacterium]|jgi:3-phosphoshikimate 1-carboxyvinyltransferase|nr:3-phosphoshikimate 1-carboxyvinyltransferase [Verrucomicrobiae bacterium]
MPLPDLIEIVPLDKPVRAEITVPGSKSITNRALILAALANADVTLKGALWSEDTQIMVDCLKELGFVVNVSPDPDEPCNRTILVIGQGGLVPAGGTVSEPLELFVGNAGTAARFLVPFLCLGSGVYRLHGTPRMHERPQAALFEAVRELGYNVESENENDKLPARIFSGDIARSPESQTEYFQRKSSETAPKTCHVSIEESSQFASALLLSAKAGNWKIEITGENADESPYVAMTSKLIEAFPKNGGVFQIEPDASSGSYFWAASTLLKWFENTRNTEISICNWPESGWQIDAKFRDYSKNIISDISREGGLGDSIMTAIVMSPLEKEPKKFTDLGRLRVQECERVTALRTELTNCGAKVVEEGDTLTVFPSPPEELHGAEIETYNDHRVAMCFAILGLKVPGIKIKNPACVKKTFPNFFQKLATAPPQGLGVEIWEVKDGKRTRKLEGADLFAD